ncbi:MAG: polymerase delta [Verrucomicrobiales bacterium]|jgi:DNA polymerase-3 subunit delta|nr:polymerase delta [Verrucomicrobiales bacterium]
MPPSATVPGPLLLVCGDDEFAVKQRSKEVFQSWSKEAADQEILDGTVSNGGEALKVLSRLRESLQTLPFFGGKKAIWLQGVNFLGDERAASSSAVTETLAEIALELKAFKWTDVQLLISSGKADKRKLFYKAIEKTGAVESFAGLTMDDKNWVFAAEQIADRSMRERGKSFSDDALPIFVQQVGPNTRLLNNEIEKLSLYLNRRLVAEVADVETIVVKNKQSKAFALADAVGKRDLPLLLRCLDKELHEMKTDTQKSEIGVLYGIISKIRHMIIGRELIGKKKVSLDVSYPSFKTVFDKINQEFFTSGEDSVVSVNAYMLHMALRQSQNYTMDELVRAMAALLNCNLKLVTSGLDGVIVLQQTLVGIVSKNTVTIPQIR